MRPKICFDLDRAGIEYRVIHFSKPVFTVEESAAESGLALSQIVKSIVLFSPVDGYVLGCIPGDKKIDAAKVSRAAGFSRRPQFASSEQVKDILGIGIGAVTPLVVKDKMPIIFDISFNKQSQCSVSAGEHIYELELKTSDLIKYCKLILADIIRDL